MFNSYISNFTTATPNTEFQFYDSFSSRFYSILTFCLREVFALMIVLFSFLARHWEELLSLSLMFLIIALLLVIVFKVLWWILSSFWSALSGPGLFQRLVVLARERNHKEFLRDTLPLFSSIGDNGTTNDFSIHVCADLRCTYMSHLHGLVRDNDSEYGFCERARFFLSNPSGIYFLLDGKCVAQTSFTYDSLYKGYPLYSAMGAFVVQPIKASFIRAKSDICFYPGFRWLLETWPCLKSFFGVETFSIDSTALYDFAMVKFEGNPESWLLKDISRTGLRRAGTCYKTMHELNALRVLHYYRQSVGEDFEGYGKIEWRNDVLRCYTRKIREVSVNIRALTEDISIVDKSTVEHSKPPGQQPGNTEIQADFHIPNRDVVHQEGFGLDKNSDTDCEVLGRKISELIISEPLRGLPILGEPNLSDIRVPETTTGLKKEKEFPQLKGKRQKVVAHGLVFGTALGVFENSPQQEDITIHNRLGKAVDEPTLEVGGRKIDPKEWPGIFTMDNSHRTCRIRHVFELFEDDWVGEKVARMTAQQKRRIERCLNTILGEGEFKWTKQRVKFFMKGDEAYAKAKGRVITFIPTYTWIRLVLLLDEFLKGIKYKGEELKPQKEWYTEFIYKWRTLRVYWASGMTQDGLSEAATQASLDWHERGIYFFFVCGDDNTGVHLAMDASSYDSTQQEGFWNIQKEEFMSYFPSEDRERVDKLLDKLFGYHSGTRFTEFGKWNKPEKTLPSGGPHTLVFNSLGMQAAVKRWFVEWVDLELQEDARTLEACISAMAKCFGLQITHTINPHIQICLGGAEFLKGIFVPHQGTVTWVPDDGRICKVGKMIGYPECINKPIMARRIREIANGYSSYIKGPLLNAFYETWKCSKLGVHKESWVNIEGGQVIGEVQSNFLKSTKEFWEELYEYRYLIDREELCAMQEAIVKNGTSFAVFEGTPWKKLVSTLYRADQPCVC